MRERVEFLVVHEDGGSWKLLSGNQGPEEVVTIRPEVRGREWLAAISYAKSMYRSLVERSCYKDVLSVDVWTAGDLGVLLYSYGRHGEFFVDPPDEMGEEASA